MKLVHYSSKHIGTLRKVEQSGDGFKPRGLWVSDDDCEDNWRSWCESEQFHLEGLVVAHDVELVPNANILMLRTSGDIDAFTHEWNYNPYPEIPVRMNMYINWQAVSQVYDGMIATPYIWERRLSDAMWYYTWDCASGCIWQPRAVASIKPRT